MLKLILMTKIFITIQFVAKYFLQINDVFKIYDTYINILKTHIYNTTIIEAPFLGSGCGRVV
jgi:hypothetical protein